MVEKSETCPERNPLLTGLLFDRNPCTSLSRPSASKEMLHASVSEAIYAPL